MSISIITRFSIFSGTPSRFGVNALIVPSSLYSTLYKAGTYTPLICDARYKNSSLVLPCFLHTRKSSITSRSTSSPSPIKNISTNSAIGSGLHAQGPPATTIFVSSLRSLDFSGILESLSIFKTLVYDSSYWRVKPMKSNSDTGSILSNA